MIVQLSLQLHFTAGHSCIRNNIINVPAPTLADFFFLHCHVSTSSLLKLILVESVIVRVVLREGHGSSSGVWWQNSSTTPCHLKKTPLSTAVQEVCTFVCKSCPQTRPHTPNRPLKETLPCPPYRPQTETPLHPPYRLPTETPLTLPIDCPQKHCLAHPIDRPKKYHFTPPHRLLTETQSTEEQNKVFLLFPPPPPKVAE